VIHIRFFNIHIQGRTPLHIASLWGNYETVELLLLFGADMNCCQFVALYLATNDHS
jgi:ankyrin repeat protein